jgi:hypothetical protein
MKIIRPGNSFSNKLSIHQGRLQFWQLTAVVGNPLTIYFETYEETLFSYLI